MSTDRSTEQHATFQTGDRVDPTSESPFEGSPVRDNRGRFVSSGNPRGRPRRLKEPEPTTLAEAGARALCKRVPVRINGQSKDVIALEAIGMKLVNQALSGSSLETHRAVRMLLVVGALSAAQDLAEFRDGLAAQNSQPAWTPELEERYRLLESEYEDGWESEGERRAASPRKDDCGTINDPQP